MKNNLYQILGYAGLLPFIGFAVGAYLTRDSVIIFNLCLLMQLSYAVIITSFVSATHYVEATKSNKTNQILLSIAPPILSLPILFWAFTHSPAQSLLAVILLFWFVFVLDRVFLNHEDWPRRYFVFRFNLTALVTIILFSTFWIAS